MSEQTPIDLSEPIPCPFVYADGHSCPGRIVRIEAYKADLIWEQGPDGQWRFGFSPRSHYHLFCSEKGNHAGYRRMDDQQMKLHWRELPPEIDALFEATGSVTTVTPAA